MARRTAQEIIGSMRELFGEQSADGYLTLLEDIMDSVTDVDLSNYVSKDDYDKVVTERDTAVAGEKSMRDRYINRFYSGYESENDKGIILSESPQKEVQREEEVTHYEDLFE